MSDFDRNKYYNKKKFPSRESANFGSRFFNNKSSPHREIDKDDAKPRSIKKTTILAREHHVEDRSLSPKNVVKEGDQPSITIAAPPHATETVTLPRMKEMTKSVKFLDDGVICTENIQEYLQENDDYLVVGIVGTQGVGKSTILNLLAHSNITEKLKRSIFKYSENGNQSLENIKIFSDYYVNQKDSDVDPKVKVDDIIFKPQSFSELSNNSSGTNGIDFFITRNRIIFLDCQPFTSVSLLDDFIRSESKLSTLVSDFTPLENSGEIQGLQMTAFLMSVCHVLILVQDWFFDSNVLRFIQSAEMLKPTISNPEDEMVDHFPHLVLIHNKAQMDDFSPHKFKQMQLIYKSIFNKTKMHVESGMGIGSGGVANTLSKEVCGSPINLFLIPEYEEFENLYRGHPPLEELIKNLRSKILGATKYLLSNTNEKHWLIYCSKVWDHVKKSNFFIEYNKLMP